MSRSSLAGALSVLPVAAGALFLAACAIPYKPTLKMEATFHTIPARVLVQPLRDDSPPDDKVSLADGVIAQTGAMDGNLDALVTKAISADFSATAVFRSIGRSENRPDLVLSGTIRRFYGQATIPFWLLVPGVNWMVNAFASPVQEWQGEVDLEVTLAMPEGRVLGSYRGRSEYQELAERDSRFWAMPLYPAHARLNRAFTEAVEQIRDQMFGDREKLIAAIRR